MGWSPKTALTTTISQIELAIRGRIEWAKMTNPFGSSEEDEDAKKLAEHKPAPELAAQQLLSFVQRHQARDARHKKKPKT